MDTPDSKTVSAAVGGHVCVSPAVKVQPLPAQCMLVVTVFSIKTILELTVLQPISLVSLTLAVSMVL